MKNYTFELKNTLDGSKTTAILCNEESLPKLSTPAFEGKYLQTSLVHGQEHTTLYVGVGDLDKITPLEIKEIGAKVSKTFKSEKIYAFSLDFGPIIPNLDYYRNISQGIILGTYTYSLKSKKEETPNWKISLLTKKEDNSIKAALQEGITLAESTVIARDFINAPANFLRPAEYAEKIKNLLTPLGVEVEIKAGEQLKEMGMGGLYAVGNSSSFAPQLVVMRYAKSDDKKIALVGKGITYDTGGYSLKPSNFMATMEGDMAGSAAVVSTIYALAKNNIKTNVVGVAVLAENRLSNSAILPGDVYTAYDGQTVEVLNTDAEGRLVLADGVAYAAKDENADMILDIATLTGAVVRTLGYGVAGVVTNENEMWEKLEKASALSGERYWNFPTYREYHKMLESKVADIQNIGKPEGGSITGGLFVGSFVDKKPWIHLDIAGTSWMETPLFEYQTVGGQGAGVDTMYYFCKENAS